MTGERNVTRADGKGMPRIVAGVHGTAASEAALDWAAREARLRRAQLHLVLARDPTVSRWAPYASPPARLPATLTPSGWPGLPPVSPGCSRRAG